MLTRYVLLKLVRVISKSIICLIYSRLTTVPRIFFVRQRRRLGVMNGPLKFLTARKILPLLDLLAKFKRVSLARAPKIFAAARMVAFLSV